MGDGNVFLAPCDPENFDRTVRSAVDLNDYPDHPDALDGTSNVRFWGVRTGSNNETYFEKMVPGDLVLFYQEGSYIGAGLIGLTFEDEHHWASSTFWQDAPSYLIYTIENFTPISVPRTAVNRIFDYSEEYNPQGLIRVADGRVDNQPKAIKRAVEKYSEKH